VIRPAACAKRLRPVVFPTTFNACTSMHDFTLEIYLITRPAIGYTDFMHRTLVFPDVIMHHLASNESAKS